MSKRVFFPHKPDDFGPLDLNARNNDLGSDGEMDIETLEVHVRQLQKAVGAKRDAYDTESHEARLQAIEEAIAIVGVIDTGNPEGEQWIDTGA